MGSDGFHDIVIENLATTPAWRSSHVSPSDMTALHRDAGLGLSLGL